jgi:Domain of unknown function (DUF4279)
LLDLVAQLAVSEVVAPTLGVTIQVLTVHKLAIRDGIAVISRIECIAETATYCVYFKIDTEPYYLVVTIGKKNGKMLVLGSYIEAAVRVYLRISSTIHDPITITEKVKLNPTKSVAIGESHIPQLSNFKSKNNRWYFEPQQDTPGELERKLNFLIDRLEPFRSNIIALQNECEICIMICYEGYRGWMGGWHIDLTTIHKIAALGAEIDFDLYAYGENELPE